jgi:hypothetical protein
VLGLVACGGPANTASPAATPFHSQSIANALGTGGSQTTTLYPADQGSQYHLSVDSECIWTVTLRTGWAGGVTKKGELKMWAVIAAFFGAVLSFAGAVWGVRVRSSDLKLQLQLAHDGLEQQLRQAHDGLEQQLHEESENLERSISAQAMDLKQQLTFEGARDKRTIYAAALAALKKFEIDGTDDNETAARVAVSGVALVARQQVSEAAQLTLEALCRSPGGSAGRASRFGDSWNQMVRTMRIDLGVNEPWQPATTNPPTPGGHEGAMEPTPAGE